MLSVLIFQLPNDQWFSGSNGLQLLMRGDFWKCQLFWNSYVSYFLCRPYITTRFKHTDACIAAVNFFPIYAYIVTSVEITYRYILLFARQNARYLCSQICDSNFNAHLMGYFLHQTLRRSLLKYNSSSPSCYEEPCLQRRSSRRLFSFVVKIQGATPFFSLLSHSCLCWLFVASLETHLMKRLFDYRSWRNRYY